MARVKLKVKPKSNIEALCEKLSIALSEYFNGQKPDYYEVDTDFDIRGHNRSDETLTELISGSAMEAQDRIEEDNYGYLSEQDDEVIKQRAGEMLRVEFKAEVAAIAKEDYADDNDQVIDAVLEELDDNGWEYDLPSLHYYKVKYHGLAHCVVEVGAVCLDDGGRLDASEWKTCMDTLLALRIDPREFMSAMAQINDGVADNDFKEARTQEFIDDELIDDLSEEEVAAKIEANYVADFVAEFENRASCRGIVLPFATGPVISAIDLASIVSGCSPGNCSIMLGVKLGADYIENASTEIGRYVDSENKMLPGGAPANILVALSGGIFSEDSSHGEVELRAPMYFERDSLSIVDTSYEGRDYSEDSVLLAGSFEEFRAARAILWEFEQWVTRGYRKESPRKQEAEARDSVYQALDKVPPWSLNELRHHVSHSKRSGKLFDRYKKMRAAKPHKLDAGELQKTWRMAAFPEAPGIGICKEQVAWLVAQGANTEWTANSRPAQFAGNTEELADIEMTALAAAACRCDAKGFLALVEAGASLDSTRHGGATGLLRLFCMTVLHRRDYHIDYTMPSFGEYVKWGAEEIGVIKLLLEVGADVNISKASVPGARNSILGRMICVSLSEELVELATEHGFDFSAARCDNMSLIARIGSSTTGNLQERVACASRIGMLGGWVEEPEVFDVNVQSTHSISGVSQHDKEIFVGIANSIRSARAVSSVLAAARARRAGLRIAA